MKARTNETQEGCGSTKSKIANAKADDFVASPRAAVNAVHAHDTGTHIRSIYMLAIEPPVIRENNVAQRPVLFRIAVRCCGLELVVRFFAAKYYFACTCGHQGPCGTPGAVGRLFGAQGLGQGRRDLVLSGHSCARETRNGGTLG